MYMAMNRFRVAPGREETFLRAWRERDSYLTGVAGFLRFRLLAGGASNRQIADRMGLAEKTVRNYVSSILAKLALESRSQAAAYAIRNRLPELGGGRA